MNHSIALISIASLLASSSALAIDLESARSFSAGLNGASERIQAIVDRIASNPRESDELAMPILIEASTGLIESAALASEVVLLLEKVATLPNPVPAQQQANLAFTKTCLKTATTRSKLSRARIAASKPPTSAFDTNELAAFGSDINDVVVEVSDLRTAAECP